MIRLLKTTFLSALWLSFAQPALAEAEAPEPTPCVFEKQAVDVEATGSGWLVTRGACPDETDATLTYQIDGKTRGTVKGTQTDSKWAFAVPEKPPTDSIVTLDFAVLHKLGTEDTTAATKASEEFASKLNLAVKESFDQAVDAARGAAQEGALELTLASFKGRLRKRVAELLSETPLSKIYYEGKPAAEVLLEKAKFRKLGANDWEPLPEAIDGLRESATAPWRKLWNAELQVSETEKEALKAPVPCLGDVKALTESDKAAKIKALGDCFGAVARAAKAAKAANSLVKVDHSQEKDKAKAKKEDEQLAKSLDDATAKMDQFARQPESAFTSAPADAASSQPARSALVTADAENAWLTIVSVLKPGTSFHSDASAANNGVNYVAALLIQVPLRAELEKQVSERFALDAASLRGLSSFARTGRGSEMVRVPPANPRFFVSTGFVASALNENPLKDPWKLAIPVLVSICPSTHGCQTKGIGSGGNWANYVSLDVGVNVTFLGDRDARVGLPSVLAGVGFTPIYATHFGVGINFFDNPQSDEMNSALYFSLTLDLVDGADILGAIGLAKPEPQVIGEKKKEEEKTEEKKE
jgi:hypothetical protein